MPWKILLFSPPPELNIDFKSSDSPASRIKRASFRPTEGYR
jgi:hypothetical protein